MTFSRSHVSRAVLALSVLSFGVSLFLPALLFGREKPLYGAQVLAWGWWGALSWDFAWYANIAYAVAVVSCARGRRKAAIAASAVALVLGLTSFLAREWWFNEGNATPIAGLGPAFYVWLVSFCILLLGYFAMERPAIAADTQAFS